MKRTYLIYDEIGIVGRQLAGDKTRAIALFRGKHPDTVADCVGKLAAYDWANDSLPTGFEAE